MDARTTETSNGATSGPIAKTGAKVDSEWDDCGNPNYVGDFTADIEAITGDVKYSSVNSNAHTSSIFPNLNSQARDGPSGINTSVGYVYAETTASVEVQHGSIYDLAEPLQPVDHDCHTRPSSFESEEIGLSPLDMWMSTQERHDLISYQGVKPLTRKRKATKGQREAPAKKRSRR